MSLQQRYRWGMLSGAGSVVVKTALNILLMPAIIARLGLDAFGFYIFLSALLEVSFLLDFGGLNALVKLLGDSSKELTHTYLKVGHLWFGLLSLLFLVFGLMGYPFLASQFHLSPALSKIAPLCFPMVILEAAITLYSAYPRAVLLSHCAHQWTNIGDTLYAILGNTGAILVLFAGYGLPMVLAVRLLSSFLRLGLMMVKTMVLEPAAFDLRIPFRWDAFKTMMHLGSHALMINFSIIISHKIDDIVIARFLPMSAVGIYEMVFRVLGIILQICLKLQEGAYPLFAKMATLKQTEDARNLFLRMSGMLNVVVFLAMMLVVAYYPDLLHALSAGQISFNQTLPVLLVAIPCIWSGVLQMPASAWLFAWGYQRYLTVSSLLAASANLVLSLLLVRHWGIVGVAVGTLIPQLIQHQGSLIRKSCAVLGISFPVYLRTVYGTMVLPLCVATLWVYCWRFAIPPAIPSHGLRLFVIALIGGSALLLGGVIWFYNKKKTELQHE